MATTFFKTVSNNRVTLSPERYRELQAMKERQKKIDERYARQAAERHKAEQQERDWRNGHHDSGEG